MLFRRTFRPWLRNSVSRKAIRRAAPLQMTPLEQRLAPALFVVSAQPGATNDAKFLAAIAAAKADLVDPTDSIDVDVPVALTAAVTIDDTKNLRIFSSNGQAITAGSAARMFNFTSASSVTLTIESITLNGNGTVTGAGGAVLMSNQSLVANSATFQNFRVTTSGGAISATGAGATLTISNSSFLTNTATTSGGALHTSGSTPTLNITNSTFTSNSAGSSGGGAIAVASLATSQITGSTFTSNFGNTNAGAINTTSTITLNISTSSFLNNRGSSGGAIRSSGTSVSLNIDKSVLSGNTAASTSGGAVYLGAGTGNGMVVTNSAVVNNTATSVGGGLRASTASITVNNSTISGNTASSTVGGGGIYLTSGALSITFSTIANNRAPSTTSTAGGGGIRRNSATANPFVLDNSVVAQNFSATGGPDIHASTSGAFPITGTNSFIGIADVGFIDVSGIANVIAGTGAGLSPGLPTVLAQSMTPYNTFYLQPISGSPLRNAGSNAVTQPSTDQRGGTNLRLLDGTVDIGAIESTDPTPSGKLVTVADITSPLSTLNTFEVTYSDSDGDLNLATLATAPSMGASDVELLDPYGNRVPITAASLNMGGTGFSATVTYTFTIPGGSWDILDNGTYSVKLLPNEVLDLAANPAAPVVVGTFRAGVNGTVTVTTAADVSNPTDGLISLREAVALTQPFDNGLDTITFATGISPVVSSVITFNDPIHVLGLGATSTSISGNNANAIFAFASGISGGSTIEAITLKEGKVTGSGSAVNLGNNTLTITDSVISDNSSSAAGGAIFIAAGGNLTIEDSTIRNNTSNTTGGGVGITGAGTLVVNRSTIAGNFANTTGGGIETTTGTITIDRSTLSGNVANSTTTGGGGLSFSTGTVTIINSTFTGNRADAGASASGGAIRGSSSGTLTITHATIYDNTASRGGGIAFVGTTSTTVTNVNLVNTIVAGNSDTLQLDLFSATTFTQNVNGDNNIIGLEPVVPVTLTSGTNIVGIGMPLDVKLAPLFTFAGENTAVHAVLSGSPALNAGKDAGVTEDQRGKGRDATPNIGAFEGILLAPIAQATLGSVVGDSVGAVTVSVVYTDEGSINLATLTTSNVVLNGPSFTNKTPDSRVISGTGTPSVTVTYTWNAPGPFFVPADNGIYTLTMLGSQVFDNDMPTPNFVLPGTLGTLKVDVPVTHTVDKAGDLDDGIVSAGELTLREAVRLSNDGNKGFTDNIKFSPTLNGTTITLTGELTITDPVNIIGNGMTSTVISGGGVGRIFNFGIAGADSLSTISGLSLLDGKPATGNGGAILLADDALTISNVRLANNGTTAGSTVGGAISVAGGALTISDSELVNNTSVGNGGAIHNSNGGTVISLTRTTLSGNTAGGIGGAVYNSLGVTFVRDTTISGNTAGSSSGGGGISASTGTVSIINSTISGNSATNGAAVGGGVRISGAGTLTVSNSTITRNTASGNGGGISLGSATAKVAIDSSIVAQNLNVNHPDLFSSVTTTMTINGLNNFIGAITDFDILFSGFGQTGDAKLAPLADNGGPTQTHALNVLSGALNTGANPLTLDFDQRGSGFTRSLGQTDVGAFEGLSKIPQGFATLSNVPPVDTTYTFTVTYTDDTSISIATLGNNDVEISGRGYPTPVVATYVNDSGPGQVVTVTYSVPAPVGGWTAFHNGTYTVSVLANGVSDGVNAVPAGAIGSFTVSLTGSFVVDDPGDADDGSYGPGELTFREAMFFANLDPNTIDTITFAPALNGQTIALGSTVDVLGPVSVVGNGPTQTIISGSGSVRPFLINLPGVNNAMSMSSLTITAGTISGTGGAISMTDDSVTLTNVHVTQSQGTSGGAIAMTTGVLNITDSRIAGNTATSAGGGISFTTGVVSLLRVTIANNVAGTNGGGIDFTTGTLTVSDSTLSGNTANSISTGGGGVNFTTGSASFTNSTLSGNSAPGTSSTTIGGAVGGAVRVTSTGTLVINNSTVTRNTAGGKGGGLGFSGATSTTLTNVTLNSTVLADNVNAGAPDLFSATTATLTMGGDYNLLGNWAGITNIFFPAANNQIGTVTTVNPIDPQLAPLANYGGTTETHAPLLGSLVLDKGFNAASISKDQRGEDRPLDPFAFDVGSVEGALVDPNAILGAPLDPVTTTTSPYVVTVVYVDEGSINLGTIDGTDITVTRPNGSTVAGITVGSITGSGGSVTVTYNVPAVGGAWSFTQNGIYSVKVNAGAVADNDTPTANTVNQVNLGTFQVGLPGSIVVDLATDEDDGDLTPGDVSLREAVRVAGSVIGGAGTVTFAPALNGQTITLTLGQMNVIGSIVINGPGADKLTVSGNNASRIFNLDDGTAGSASVTMSGLTLTQGLATGDGGAINNQNEHLSLTDMVLTNNSATFDGGALNVETDGAIVTLLRTVISNNRAGTVSGNDPDGGGINFQASVTATIKSSTIINNTTYDDGGGLLFYHTVTSGRSVLIEDSLIANNRNTGGTGSYGGAVNFGGPFDSLVIRNSTVTGNTTTAQGGGLQFYNVDTPTSIINSTIAFNHANTLAGGINQFTDSSGLVTLVSTIVSNNSNNTGTNGIDINSANGFVDAKNSAIGIRNVTNFTDSGANLFGLDLKLQPLASNGGPMQSVALGFGSPAINAGLNPDGVLLDQRGFPRSVGTIDMGSYEVNPAIKVTGLVINNGDAQRSRVTTLRLNFDTPVGFDNIANAFTLTRVSDSATVGLNAVLDPTGTFVTITFTGGAVDGMAGNYSLADGRYVLTALAAEFNGDGLDGDGNGTAGDNYVSPTAPYVAPSTPPVGIFRLFGDADGSGVVDSFDFLSFRLAFLSSNDAFDADGSGVVDPNDFLRFRLNFLKTVV